MSNSKKNNSDQNNGEHSGDAAAESSGHGETTLRQKLAWATGDRTQEAKALAKTVDDAGAPEAEVLAAAKQAVADAHGDSGVNENDPVTSDVAKPTDVLEKL